MTVENTYSFIAHWNKEIGAKIIDSYPKDINLDLELITMQIFIAFQNFYLDENEDNKIKRTFFKLPIKNINKIASIFLDSLLLSKNTTSGEDIPYIVVFLFPSYLSEKEIEEFDKIIYNIGAEYNESKQTSLEKYYKKIIESLQLKEKVQDADVQIEGNYKTEDALIDFKKGIELFSQKKFEQSYFFIKKAHLKFEKNKNIKLLLETSFFLGSLLSQLNKLTIAQRYFEFLEDLSIKAQNHKYYEKSVFMSAYCYFKKDNYEDAVNQFKKLESKDLQHIDNFQFYYLYGRVLRLLNQNEKAINLMKKASEISLNTNRNNDIKEKRANLNLEIGHTYYNMAVESVKKGKFEKSTIQTYLIETLNYYEEAIKLWDDLNDFIKLLNIYKLIGNIYDITNEDSLSIQNYKKALEYAEITNNVLERLNIFNIIIQKYDKLEMHEVIIKEIDEMLAKIISFAFVDLFTISKFHNQLGKSLNILGKPNEALSELLIALNIYNKFDTPVRDALTTLTTIIEIYRNKNEEKYIDYYEEQYNTLEEKIQQIELEKIKGSSILGEVKEFWFVMDDGTTVFSYAPETSFDPHLFGSFLCALQSFSVELTSERLNAISMGDYQFIFYREGEKPLFVMGRSSIKAYLDSVKSVLMNIYREFWNQYEKFLIKFDGYVSRFSNFKNWLQDAKMLEFKQD